MRSGRQDVVAPAGTSTSVSVIGGDAHSGTFNFNNSGAVLTVQGASVFGGGFGAWTGGGIFLTAGNGGIGEPGAASGGNIVVTAGNSQNLPGGNIILNPGTGSTAGNVGIGTTSPTHTLEVNGSVAGVGPYQDISDLHFKKDIAGIANALDIVMKIRGVTFDWRQEDFPQFNFTKGRQIGFIAQELQEVLPAAVAKDEKGYYRVAYSSVVPVLVEAIKLQQKTIEQIGFEKNRQIELLTQRLNEKDEEYALLEKRLAALESTVEALKKK